MASEEKPINDWINLPEGAPTLSLWDTLHDGDLLTVESDLLARTVTLRFDVGYVRDFHHLPEQTRFVLKCEGVQSVRALGGEPWPGGCSIPQGISRSEQESLIAEYHRKWRESQSWADFERLTADGLEVSNALMSRGFGTFALQFGLLVAGDSYVEAYIRGESIEFYVGEKQLAVEEFVALGEAYWDAFAKRRKPD